MKTYIALALTFAATAPCIAQEVQVARDRYVVALHRADLRSATPDAARRTLARIDRAAMAVCGASGFSLSEVKQAVRASACWHDAVADTARRIDDPLLSQTWQNVTDRRP